MLNERPIFIIGFQHGGTSVLLNWLRTHPHVCSPWGETHEVFRGAGGGVMSKTFRLYKLALYLPIVLIQREIPFHDRNWNIRRPMPNWLGRYVDWLIFKDKFRARGETQNRYKSEGIEYTEAEIAESRTLMKSTNGDIFSVDIFNKMYSDATFLGLVRNGFAVVEGHLRRNGTIEDVSHKYERGAQQLLEYSERLPNFHIIRFEDVLENPLQQFDHIYDLCDLDTREITKIRMITRPIITSTGHHEYVHGTSRETMVWINPEEMTGFLDPSVTENQIRRLSPEQKEKIVEIAGDSLRQLGYL